MLRTECQYVYKSDPIFDRLDELCFLSKNLYNHTNYLIRQEFINSSKLKELNKLPNANWLRANYLDKILNSHSDYLALPNNSSQKVIQQLDLVWKSFFNSIKQYSKNKSSFTGKPSLPKYKHKTNGRNIVIFTSNQFRIKDNLIRFPKKADLNPIKSGLDLSNTKINQIRIVPLNNNSYKIEIVYDNLKEITKIESNNYLGIDLGINNLMSLTSNKAGFQPLLINGRQLKSINQYYNKEKARLQSLLKDNTYTSNRINKLTIKRNNKIHYLLHKSSKYVKDICISNNISKVVIGLNKLWKTEVNIGTKNNQNFVNIPHSKLINILKYKLEESGIELIVREESYTSKCSFLDGETIGKSDNYAGNRIKRGLFRSSEGILINSDINGSFNILRKEFTDVIYENIVPSDRGLILNPLSIDIK